MLPVSALALSLLFTPAGDILCPADRTVPEVEIIAKRQQPVFSNNSSIADITKLGASAYTPKGAEGPSWHKNGLTQREVEIESQVQADSETFFTGLKCIYVRKIVVTVTVTPTVWVANEFPPGTCMYDAIKDHEMKHVHAAQNVLSTHTGRLRAAMEDVGRYRTVFGPDQSAAVDQLYKTFQKQLSDTIQNELTVYQYDESKAQQAIDTLQEYQRISNLCKDQLRQQANQRG